MLDFPGRNAVSFSENIYKMACIAVTYHPHHIFHLVLSALQQAVGHLHALFYYVFINRTIETDLETLLQFGFTQKALLGDLCDCQRMKEMVVNDLPCLHQTAVVLSGNSLVVFLCSNHFIAEQGHKL